MIARRHLLKLLVAAPLIALAKVHAQPAQAASPAGLSPEQRADLVRMYRGLANTCRWWAEYYAYTPRSIGYYFGRAEGFDASAAILEGFE